MFLINILFLFLILYFLFFLHKNLPNNIEKFEEHIYFLNNNELLESLLNNKDKYYNKFYKNDYITRKIKDIKDYHEKIEKSVYNFNDIQKNKIREAISNLENIIKIKVIDLNYFDNKKFINIPWKIGCIYGKLYENGLPHTRDDIIIISSQDINIFSPTKLQKTLLHEKIHLYQKKYPEDTTKYLEHHNFKKYKKREESDNIRANPDLDNWIYKNSDNKILQASYNKNPKSIEDILYQPINSQSSEHPFEKMSIEFENYIN